MKSTKYQLLRDEYNHALKEIELRNQIIKDLKEKLNKIQFLKYSFYGTKEELYKEIDRIINE